MAQTRQIHSDGVSQRKRCRVETVRAGHVEDILLKSIKNLLETPNLIEHWLEVYAQIQEWNQKIIELENLRTDLFSKSMVLRTKAIDKNELIEKLKRTIQKLETIRIESRKPLYANLIEFAELHPTKIRVGLNVPTLPFADESGKRQYKSKYQATGTDGGPLGQNLNFNECEPKNLKLVNSVGSTTVTIGAGGGT